MMDDVKLTLNSIQYETIIRTLSDDNWLQFWLSNFISLLLAIAIGWWVPRIFRKADERKSAEADVRSFNFGVAYHGAAVENLVSSIESLILPELINDQTYLSNLQKATSQPPVAVIRGIPSIPIVDVEKYIKHFPMLSERIHDLLALSRMAEYIEQFNLATEQRTDLATEYSRGDELKEQGFIIRKFGQIEQRTYMMTVSIESALDAALKFSDVIASMHNKLVRSLRKNGLKKMSVTRLIDNETYFLTLKNLRSIVDNDPAYKNRHKHFSLTRPRPLLPKIYDKQRSRRALILKLGRKHLPSLFKPYRKIRYKKVRYKANRR